MANSRNDPSRKRFGLSDGDRRGPRANHVSSGTGFNSDTVEKRGLNAEVSKVTVRPASPKPIVTNQTTQKPSGGDGVS